MENTANIAEIIIGAVVTFGFFIALGFLLKNRLYKKLRERFSTNEAIPKNAFPAYFTYGFSDEEGGSRIKIAEKGKNLLIEFKFLNCTIKIPFEKMEKTKLSGGLFGGQTLRIKVDGIKKLRINFKKKHLNKIPHLTGFIQSRG